MPLQGLLKERTSGQMVSAAAGSCPSIPWSGLASYEQQGSWLAQLNFTSSKLALLPHDRPMNLRGRGNEETLTGELEDPDDGRGESQNNYLVRAWLPVSFINQS